MDSVSRHRKLYRFGEFEFDVKDGILRKRGLRLRIQPQPARVLKSLLERPGELVTRDELREKLWPTDTFVDFEQGLNSAVTRLRQSLGDSADNPRFISTEARLGYRMVASVQLVGAIAESESNQQHNRNIVDPEQQPAESGALIGGYNGHANGPRKKEELVGDPTPEARANFWSNQKFWRTTVVALVLVLAAGVWQARREVSARQASAELAYQRGMALLRDRTLQKVRQGTDELRRAVEENPRFARAWAGLAESAILLNPTRADTAIEYARKAVELDTECGECHAILGLLLFSTKWKWDEAGVHLAKGAALKPDDAGIQISIAQREAALGRITHAVEILDKAAKQFPRSLNIGAVRAQFLYYARDYEGAIRESDRLSSINLTGGLEWKANALFQMGRNAEAVYILHGFLGSWSSASPETIANRMNAAVARFEKAGLEGALGDLLKLMEPPPAARIHSHNRARWLMLLGKHERAIKELQVALSAGIRDVIFLKVDPVFDPIQSHPEFLQILKIIGLDK